MEHAVDTISYLEAPFCEETAGSRPPPPLAVYVETRNLNRALRLPWSPAGLEPLTQTGVGHRLILRDLDFYKDRSVFRINDDHFPALVVDTFDETAFAWTAQIKKLRDTLGLPITALVEALNITRPTFYEWLRGEQPNRSNQQRIRVLLQIAEEWSKLRIGAMSRYWNVPTRSCGMDLRNVLMNPSLSLESFNTFLSQLGIRERVLPPRASQPIVTRNRKGKSSRPRKAWGTTPSDAE